jgi:hypothetical protein
MIYYRSTAYTISQGFQKVLICYFTNFLWFTMNFQSSAKIKTNRSLWHYSYVSRLHKKTLPFRRIHAQGPSRDWSRGTQRSSSALAGRGHSGGGGVAVRHGGVEEHPWVAEDRRKMACGHLATYASGDRGDLARGGGSPATSRPIEARVGRRRGRQSWWWC